MNPHIRYIIIGFFLINCFFFCHQTSFSQNDYVSGYIINNQNDTLRGMIKDRNEFPLKRYSKIRFIDQKGKKRKLGSRDIRGYVRGSAHYETHWYDGKERFLKVQLKGWISYYQHEYVISSDDGSYIETEKLLQRFGENLFLKVEFFGFRRKMRTYLSDCPEIVEKLNAREYRFKDLTKLVLDYNRIMLAKKAMSPPK